MTSYHYTSHKGVNTLIETRAANVRRANRRFATTLGALAVGGAMLAGAMLTKSDAPSLELRAPNQAAAQATAIPDARVVSAGIYHERNATALASRLRDDGFAVGILPAGRYQRVLIRADDYATTRAAITELALHEKVVDAEHGTLKDGRYRALTLVEQRDEAIDRYVCEDKRLPFDKENARRDVADYFFPVIKQESGFKPHATSKVGATGLMQIMPDTARLFDNARHTTPTTLKKFPEYDCFRETAQGADLSQRTPQEYRQLLKNPWLNTDYGIAVFLQEYKACRGDMPCTLARYNGGPNAHHPENRVAETRQYVRNIMSMANRQ